MRPAQQLHAGEHDFERVRGLPAELPPGERVLWQGAPDWKLLALQAFHVRALALYFALLLSWRCGAVLADGGGVAQALTALLWPLPLALLALALVSGLAWLSARTTVYTLTNRRVVLRVGMVLSISFNLPLARIESAAVRRGHHGSGDICLLLMAPQRIAYLHLWPHARPWRLARSEPMLRALRDVDEPARCLNQALADTLALQPREAVAANQGRPQTRPLPVAA